MNQRLYPTTNGASATKGPAQAALTLHAVSEDDRSWVLSQLPEDQATELKGMLSELIDLGIPSDPTLLDQCFAQGCEAMQPLAEPSSSLEQISLDQLLDLIRDEPIAFIAHLRLLAPKTWAALLTRVEDPSFRESLHRASVTVSSERGERLRKLIEAILLQQFEVLKTRQALEPRTDAQNFNGLLPHTWSLLKSLVRRLR